MFKKESKRKEVTGGRRILHDEKLNNFNPSLYIIMIFKSRRMRLARPTERFFREPGGIMPL